ncbi:MAG: cobalt transporter subunit CbtA [Oceanicoccus sp.]|jgi:cobalt transporter subunit CbtA
MLFRRIILAALLVGLVAGLVLSLAQITAVNPIIFAAETFEVEEVSAEPSHNHASHDHGEEEWAPADGAERTGYTVAANVSAGVGFAAIMLALMSQLQLQGIARVTTLKGLAWGLGGFIAFFVAPGIGLPPEIPGIEAAPVEHRQTWWLFAVISVGTGLLVLSLAPWKLKALGLGLAALPYLVNIPHHDGPAFAHPDAEAVATLAQLHQEFIIASGFSNFAFWLVLGALSAWLLKRLVLTDEQLNGTNGEPASV